MSISAPERNESNSRSRAPLDFESDGAENYSPVLEKEEADPTPNSDKAREDHQAAPMRRNHPTIDDDNEEDEDALFSYVAFPKEK
jgi:hypothetical protein